MTTNSAVVIFAKHPSPGRVKTRLTQDEIPGWGFITPEQAADLYRAFLMDYIQRFTQSLLPLDAMFCLRPGPQIEKFESEFADNNLPVLTEPTWNGKQASSIGEAMGFTIRHLLATGYRKVMILGSDLPHLEHSLLAEADRMLDSHRLVLGNDGGGCFLVGASSDPISLVDSSVVWSQGKDFHQLCELEKHAGHSVGVLSQTVEDLDTPSDLLRFLELAHSTDSYHNIVPNTLSVLKKWGLYRGGRHDETSSDRNG